MNLCWSNDFSKSHWNAMPWFGECGSGCTTMKIGLWVSMKNRKDREKETKIQWDWEKKVESKRYGTIKSLGNLLMSNLMWTKLSSRPICDLCLFSFFGCYDTMSCGCWLNEMRFSVNHSVNLTRFIANSSADDGQLHAQLCQYVLINSRSWIIACGTEEELQLE